MRPRRAFELAGWLSLLLMLLLTSPGVRVEAEDGAAPVAATSARP
jgi:hypothetical protein